MELSHHLREVSKTISGREQFFWQAFARMFEVRFQLNCFFLFFVILVMLYSRFVKFTFTLFYFLIIFYRLFLNSFVIMLVLTRQIS